MFCCLMATFYDRSLAAVEARTLGAWRDELLSGLTGRVVELGSGTGVNLSRYPGGAEEVVLTEPDPHMRRHLRRHLQAHPDRGRITLQDAPAERLPFPDSSVDTVVSTLVLCTVPDPHAVLTEVRRVLRNDGRLLFIEHVAAPPGTSAARWQKRLEPIWGVFAGGCRLTRPTAALLQEAGFSFDSLQTDTLSPAPWFIKPAIRGVARMQQ